MPHLCFDSYEQDVGFDLPGTVLDHLLGREGLPTHGSKTRKSGILFLKQELVKSKPVQLNDS